MFGTPNASIDNYCERTGPEFWSEPLNAVTNLSFIVAGLAGLMFCRRWRSDSFARLLAWWVIVIGTGSALFHTFANRLTMLADVLPIGGFIILFTWYTISRFLALPRFPGGFVLVAFYGLTFAAVALAPDRWRDLTNGTISYAPALLALLFFGAWLQINDHKAARYLLAAAGVFLVSAVFRSVDEALCETMPYGTHFMWHTLNGLVLGLLVASAAIHGGKRAA